MLIVARAPRMSRSSAGRKASPLSSTSTRPPRSSGALTRCESDSANCGEATGPSGWLVHTTRGAPSAPRKATLKTVMRETMPVKNTAFCHHLWRRMKARNASMAAMPRALQKEGRAPPDQLGEKAKENCRRGASPRRVPRQLDRLAYQQSAGAQYDRRGNQESLVQLFHRLDRLEWRALTPQAVHDAERHDAI